ncbi:ATP-binding protein [Streptomyces rubellomurinus]|uniref:ATP-binding protein n=1 Tax=Streptomyces rubellomurinus (strain ATCC 31215) TaxID=359131 RepID=UPI000698E2FF|nr:ATP-binding protein [Streptomyces rubellomurinus]
MSVATVDQLGELRLVLPALRPEAMGRVRQIVRAQLWIWRKSEFADVAELGVTELLTNVLLHTGGGGELVVRETADGIRVAVTDFDGRLPVAGEPGRDATGGRGLLLLARLVGELETELLPRGKQIRFSLHCAAREGDGTPEDSLAMAVASG